MCEKSINFIGKLVQSATDKKVRISVGFLDIDDFKDYNTNYGHQEGDNVIKFVANTLKENFKGEVGRNGGDEFVFGYEGDHTKQVLLNVFAFPFPEYSHLLYV